MRYRAFRVTVATVSDALIDEYKKITGATDKREVIIKRVIEEKILFRKLTCKEDVAELKEIALGQFYNLPGEMISYFLRKEIEDKMKICKNCPYLRDFTYCPIINANVNPYQSSCGTV